MRYRRENLHKIIRDALEAPFTVFNGFEDLTQSIVFEQFCSKQHVVAVWLETMPTS